MNKRWKETQRKDLQSLVRLAREHYIIALDVFSTFGSRRLERVFEHALSNGTTNNQLERDLWECLFIHHGPSPEFLLVKLSEEVRKEKMPQDFVEGIETRPKGLCLGYLCSYDGQVKLPVRELIL